MQVIIFVVVLISIHLLSADAFFTAPNLPIGEISMSNVFKQYRESKVSATLLTEANPISDQSAITDASVEVSFMVFRRLTEESEWADAASGADYYNHLAELSDSELTRILNGFKERIL